MTDHQDTFAAWEEARELRRKAWSKHHKQQLKNGIDFCDRKISAKEKSTIPSSTLSQAVSLNSPRRKEQRRRSINKVPTNSERLNVCSTVVLEARTSEIKKLLNDFKFYFNKYDVKKEGLSTIMAHIFPLPMNTN